MLNKRLFPYFEAEGGNTGSGQIAEGGAVDNPSQPQEGHSDGNKTGADVKAEAQKIADYIVAKKLKNMPSKEELAEFREWQEKQKSEAEKFADAQKKLLQEQQAAEAQIARANAMMSVLKSGISADKAEDAIILAMAKVNDETTIEEAIKQVAEQNPSWKGEIKTFPNGGSNPALGVSEDVSKIKRYF